MRITLSLRLIFCLSFFWQAAVAAVEKEPSMATQLADHYLKSFVEEGKLLPKVNQDKKGKASDTNITEIYLSPRAERAVVFNKIFANSMYYQEQYQKRDNLLNRYAWNDLHLFCGTTTTPTYHLLSRINKTITVLGEGALASLISAPITNLQLLTKRQQLIGFLCQEAQVGNDLKKELNSYKRSEKAILSFWTKHDPLYSEEYNKYLTELFYTHSAASNKTARSLQIKKVWLRDILNIYSNYIWYPLLGLVSTEVQYWFINRYTTQNVTRSFYYACQYWDYIPIYGLWHIYKLKPKDIAFKKNELNLDSKGQEIATTATNFLKTGRYIYTSLVTIHSLYQYYIGYCNYKEYAGVLKNLALRMADVQTFWATAKKINELVENNPRFEALYGQQLAPIRKLLACVNESSEVGNLLHYLEELPLRSWSYLWDNAGKLLASYKLFVEHKAIFHDAMYALGELDAFLSVATLMQETAATNGPHAYTFTKLLSPKLYTKPHLALVEMWHPMLAPMAAIGNDVEMGTKTKTQSIILTGPNAGGKSTFLTGVAINVLLSQTLGIAAANACEMTPFSTINTYIDITDDIAAGKSLFMAEVDRFQSHLNMLKQLKKEQFSFSIFDEPFSGTNPTEGAAAEYSVLNFIGKYHNALNIVATHYPMVMLLEQNEATKGFKNYKVFINHTRKGGKIEYTYKVIPGASNQTIALDILAEQGYGEEMLEQARDIISHPEKYKKSF